MLSRVLSVIVRLSVCHTPYCIKMAERRITQTTPRHSPGTLSFSDAKSRCGRAPSSEICAQSDPPSFRTPQFRPLSAHSPSTVRAGVISSISTNRKSTIRFPTSHRRTVYVTPRDGTKRDFAVFANKIQLLSKKVCYKVSLCENFQLQSCSYIIPLFNGP